MWVWLRKMVLARYNCICWHVINMIQLLLHISDWPIIMIRPGGLLLVVPHLFAVPVSVLSVGLQLGCEKYFLRVTY
jgi:hypothetical protein